MGGLARIALLVVQSWPPATSLPAEDHAAAGPTSELLFFSGKHRAHVALVTATFITDVHAARTEGVDTSIHVWCVVLAHPGGRDMPDARRRDSRTDHGSEEVWKLLSVIFCSEDCFSRRVGSTPHHAAADLRIYAHRTGSGGSWPWEL